FFFSSRRRHTRSDRDWSSDVCSSDLRSPAVSFCVRRRKHGQLDPRAPSGDDQINAPFGAIVQAVLNVLRQAFPTLVRLVVSLGKIGRASCRERVWVSGGGVVVEGESR